MSHRGPPTETELLRHRPYPQGPGKVGGGGRGRGSDGGGGVVWVGVGFGRGGCGWGVVLERMREGGKWGFGITEIHVLCTSSWQRGGLWQLQ